METPRSNPEYPDHLRDLTHWLLARDWVHGDCRKVPRDDDFHETKSAQTESGLKNMKSGLQTSVIVVPKSCVFGVL